MENAMYYPYTKEEIIELETKISDFFKEHAITHKPNMDITATCMRLDFNVYSMDLPDKVDGVILANKVVKKIGVRNDLPLMYARKVIAHELSHYIHALAEIRDSSRVFVALKDTIFHDKKKSPLEDKMDYMAAAILVPMDSFVEQLKELDIKGLTELEQVWKNVDKLTLEYLASLYNVDVDLIERRIVEACRYVA